MEIINRILELLGDREQRELTSYLGLNAVAFSEWKSGKSKSYRKYLIEIAEFFNVSIDYLVYGKETLPTALLSDDQQKLLGDYNDLHEPEKKLALQFVSNLLLAQSPSEPEPEATIQTAALEEKRHLA